MLKPDLLLEAPDAVTQVEAGCHCRPFDKSITCFGIKRPTGAVTGVISHRPLLLHTHTHTRHHHFKGNSSFPRCDEDQRLRSDVSLCTFFIFFRMTRKRIFCRLTSEDHHDNIDVLHKSLKGLSVILILNTHCRNDY